MIPWVREKFSERRAKWLAARHKRTSAKNDALPVAEEPPEPDSDFRDDDIESGEVPRSTLLAEETAGSTSTPMTSSGHIVRTNRFPANGCKPSCLVGPKATASPPKIKKSKSARRVANSASFQKSSSNSIETVKKSTSRERIKVRIICPSARVLTFQTDLSKRLSELKNEIILELSDDPASMPHFATDMRTLGPRYRLFRADYKGCELNETLTLAQLHIVDNESLVLVGRRNHLQQMMTQIRETRPPRDEEVELATRVLPSRTVELPMVDINEIFQQSNLQFDVRKVLISLAQASAAVIGVGPYATRLIAMLKQKLINKRDYQNDTLQCLVDMGFKAEKAEYALKIHNNVYSSALEWLIQRQSEDSAMEEAAMGLQKSHSTVSPSGIISNNSNIENTAALLEIVRIYSHRDIPPSPEVVNSLVEMGFEESDVLNALKKTCNNKAAACEWLCGNRTGSLIELRDGLAQHSPILKAILELPQVQINLNNPKVLLAFLAILENEHSIRVWGGDNDTTSVITQILQKYHEEKHVLGINQFYSDR